MKKDLFLYSLFIFVFFIPKKGLSQCTAAAGATNATTCLCPPGGGTDCDLVPDISIAQLPLTQASNYTEYPQLCNPACNGNDGRLRMGVSTPIIGYGPLETRGTSFYVCGTDTIDAGTVANIPATCPTSGLPPHQLINQRIYHKSGNVMTYTDRTAGSMTYHPAHGHQHVDNWGIYTLRLSNGDPNPLNWPILGSGTKLGFCLLDIGSCNGSNGYCKDSLGNTLNSTNIVNYGLGGGNYSCSNTVQGISNGYMDTYSQSLDGMWINIPPGLCNGTYYVVVQIDPYNYFVETNENNNVVAVPITLTQQGGAVPVITANGPVTFCSGGSVTLTSSVAADYLWSTGATTQSILVTSAGNYTVTVNTTLSCSSTSLPVSITVSAPTVSASASPTSICLGQSTQLSVTHNASGTANVPVAFSTTTQVFIPDNNATGVTSPITVSGISPATLSSGMVVSVKLNLTHTYDGDLIVSLISPSGTQINLSNRRGSGGDNFTNTIFSMSASTTIANGTAPFTGSYIPDGSFNSLTGNVNGTWLLKVADVAAVDTGRIRNWTLTINDAVAAPPTFSWTSTSGFSSTTQNPTLNPTGTANYTVVVTSSNGCSGSGSVTVTVNPLPTVTANNVSGCDGTPIALSGSPSGGTYSVADPYTGPSNTYNYSYTDLNGCSNTSASASITVNPLPVVTANNVSGCDGTPIALSGTPSGGTYSVADPYTGPSNTYDYTYTDINGCSNTSASASITVNPLPVVSFTGLAATYLVIDPVVTLTPSPAGGIFSGAGIVGNTFNPAAAGVGGPYSITYTYTDGNGCSNSASSAVTVGANPYNCNVPQSVNAINIGPFSALVTWTNSTAPQFKIILQPVTPSGPNIVYTITGTPGIVSYQISGLLPNAIYKVWVKAICNNVAGSPSNIKTFATASYPSNCIIPTPLQASNIQMNKATVSWGTTATADSFLVKYTIATGTPVYKYKKVPGSKHATTISNLLSNTQYKWWVRSICGGKGYDYSVLSTFTTAGPRLSESDANNMSFVANPNPASLMVDIYFSSKESVPYSFNLTDLTGRRIYSKQIDAHAGDNSFIIDVSQYDKGIYILNLQQGERNSFLRLAVQ